MFLSWIFHLADISITVQVESLHCLAFLCSEPDDRLLLQLLFNFPSLLVPLASDSQVFGSLMLVMHSNYCSEHADYHLNLLLG
jgi:hypothetical protein